MHASDSNRIDVNVRPTSPQKAPETAAAGRIETIYKNMDPLALVGVCLYKISHDLSGFSLSEDTLIWFVAAATAIRTFIGKAYSDRLESRRRDREERERERAHRQHLELAEANRRALEAASEASSAARDLRRLIRAPTPADGTIRSVPSSEDSCH
jgi:hypothetical protein